MQGEALQPLVNAAAPAAHPAAGKAKAAASGDASALKDRTTYAETDYPHRAFGWSALRALRTGKSLYIQAPERELYDQAADPGAAHNLAPASRAVADTLRGQLEDFRKKTSQTLVD